MSAPPKSPPPTIPGFSYVDHLGSGGYADVFLYRQDSPEADVAVKVLSSGDLKVGLEAFTVEADTMAKVSDHPYIVQVFRAGVAVDGRPYFVMEYYPGPTFNDRARNERMGVDEALRVGVQVASAVETAHRAGVLHRDIKPANILTNRFDQPGLADFGIASPAGSAEVADGMSVPWAPPEAFGDQSPDYRSDVYSLAATVYTLLAGRPPFEVPAGDNGQLAMISRIESHPVPQTGRPDVPPSLEQTLALAMSKDRERRPATAEEFGRLLNGIESDLKFAPTKLILEGPSPSSRLVRADDEDATRIKGVTEIRAQEPGPPAAPPGMITGVGSGGVAGAPRAQRRREGFLEEGPSDVTVPQPDDSSGKHLPEAQKSSPSWLLGALAAVVAIGVGIAAVVFGGGGGSGSDGELDEFEVNDGELGDQTVVTPPSPVQEVNVVDNGDGTFTYSWTASDPEVEFVVTVEGEAPRRSSESVFVGASDCVEVETVNSVGLISAAVRGCTQ